MLQNGKVRIDKTKLLIFILIFPFMKTDYFACIPVWDFVFDSSRYISFICIIFFLMLKKQKISNITVVLLVLFGWLGLVTLFKGSLLGVNQYLVYYFPCMGVVLLTELFHGKLDELISVQLFCFELLIYSNLISLIIMPEGVFKLQSGQVYWILGYYNQFSRYFYPALLIGFLYMYRNGNKIRTIFLVAGIYYSAVVSWAGGIVFTLVILVIVYFLFRTKYKIFNYYTYWLLQFIFFVFFILFKFQNYFMWVIRDLLGKEKSFMQRMDLWDWTIERIEQNWLIGIGILARSERYSAYRGWKSLHSHNQILDIWLSGGLIAIILFLIIVLICGKIITKYNNTYCVQIISIGFLAWCLQAMVEPMIGAFLFEFFMLGYYCERLIYDEGELRFNKHTRFK